MAVHKGDKPDDQKNTGAEDWVGQHSQQNQDTEVAAGSIQPFGFGNAMASGTMANNMGSKEAEQLADELQKVYSANPRYDVKVLKLDKENHPLAYTVLVVCANEKDDKTRVSYIPLLIASTGTPGMSLNEIPTSMSYDSSNVLKSDMIRVPSDAMDGFLSNEVASAVDNVYDVNVNSLFAVDGIVVTSSPEILEKEHIWAIAGAALNGVAWELITSAENYSELNIGDAMVEDSSRQLVIDVRTERCSILNEIHKPVRTGFVVELVSKTFGRNVQRSVNQQNANNIQNTTIGYVDVSPVIQQIPGANGTAGTGIRFRPHVIIDGVVPKYNTPGHLMIGILNAMTIKSNDLWMHVLRPLQTDELHDPGALNYIANLENDPNGVGDKIDFYSNNLSAYDTNTTLKQMFINDIIFSIDVDVYGPQTWFTAMLASAASNDRNKASATALIVRTLDSMTGGMFGNIYNGPVFTSMSKIPTGTWIDKNGDVKDLREFDLIAISTVLGAENARLIQEWAASELDNSNSTASLAKRIEILKLVCTTATIDGWTMRLTFDSGFLLAMEQAITSAGYSADITCPNVVQGVSPLATMGDYMSGAVMPQSGTPFARTNAGGGGMYSNYWDTPGSHRSW